MAKKYLSILRKDGIDIYIRDAEALSSSSCASDTECANAASELT